MPRILISLGLISLLATSAAAQTSVVVGQPLSVTFTHNGQNTTGYRVKVDGTTIADVAVSVLQAGSALIAVPAGLGTRGAHSLTATAYNQDGETPSIPLIVTAVLPAPDAPSQPSIVLKLALNQDGTISATWSQQ
jgi:hypothetical protein